MRGGGESIYIHVYLFVFVYNIFSVRSCIIYLLKLNLLELNAAYKHQIFIARLCESTGSGQFIERRFVELPFIDGRLSKPFYRRHFSRAFNLKKIAVVLCLIAFGLCVCVP